MANHKIRLDKIADQVMDGLKDFQQETVNRVAALYENGQKRVLVSDEVGLGKTLIARGTIAQFARMAQDQGRNRIKVIYICSNAAIADQNLSKLCIGDNVKREGVSSSRLSVQHLNMFWQEAKAKDDPHFIQLIPLTPATSFRMTAGGGLMWERAVIYQILVRIPELEGYQEPLEMIMKGNGRSGWNGWAKACGERDVIECNEATDGAYLEYMLAMVSKGLKEKKKEGVSLMDEVIEICREVRKNGERRNVKTNGLLCSLRRLFAGVSLERLEPDLIIMDEFQRFRYLLQSDADSELGLLVHKFFNSEKVCILLLSATPYKMYSTLEEIDETLLDEHFSEFLNVMKFLNATDERQEQFKEIWNQYSIQLKEFSFGGTSILQAKRKAEDAMYQSVCRTERISAKESADIMELADKARALDIEEQDIVSYIQASKVLEDIGVSYHVPVDYIKSCPYLMSFMKDYKLKRDIETYFSGHPKELKLINKSCLWLKKSDIDRFFPVKSNNARLERVKEYVFQKKAELLLWVPPSRPYYPLGGVFKGAENFSKTLIFSSWEMVPRMVSSLLSYEAERRTVGTVIRNNHNVETHYFSSEKRPYPRPRLRFAAAESRYGSMSLFCLLYPSEFLTRIYDPINCMNRRLTLGEIEQELQDKIAEKLDPIKAPVFGAVDQRWYYMAALFLDTKEYVLEWLKGADNLSAGEVEKSEDSSGFQKHVHNLEKIFQDSQSGRSLRLGKKPRDLVRILADMAIASPAICANRTYWCYAKSEGYSKAEAYPSYLPSQAAQGFIQMMNKTNATAIVELACGKKSEAAHWRNVLTYCKHGNYQAVLDEYAHLLANGCEEENIVPHLHKDILNAMNIRTARYDFDTFQNFSAAVRGGKPRANRIRTHFAAAFTRGDGNDKDSDRKKAVRNAFNSPFWPFVLTSTSIGQEGLDFHNYCRRIVHWNLPSNPIDLEQREGRINRFECLAIRQNIAKRYGKISFKNNIWEELFDEAAAKEKTEASSELIPYWGLKETEDMIRIERVVPMYPFSRDREAYDRLIKILSLYRLTLGQARQEELLEYLMNQGKKPEELKDLFMNLSPYFKKHR